MDEQSKKYALEVSIFLCLIALAVSLGLTNIVPVGSLTAYSFKIFNLVFYVPPALWVVFLVFGIAIILFHLRDASWISHSTSHRLILALSLVIVIVFQTIPYITESNPRFVDSWVHGTSAKGILTSGSLQLDKLGYQTYPLSFIFLSTFSQVCGIELVSLLRIVPLVFAALFFSFLAFFANELFSDIKLTCMSILVYGLSTYELTFHFSPEIFGWLFFFLGLAFIAKGIKDDTTAFSRSRSSYVVVVLLIFAISITHPVTQFMFALILLILVLFRKRIWNHRLHSERTFHLLVIALVIFSAWALNFAISYLSSILSWFLSTFLRVISDLGFSTAAQPFQQDFPSAISNLLVYRQSLYLTTLLAGFGGLYLLSRRNHKESFFLLALLLVSFVAFPLTLFGILPLERSIKLAFIPLSILSGYLIVKRKRVGAVAIAFLLMTIPVNFASLYWNEVGKSMTHSWEISSAMFIGARFNGVILGEFKETAIDNFYGNFSKVYNDYYQGGNRPDLSDLFNYSFIEGHNVGLIYTTQLTVLSTNLHSENDPNSLFLNLPFLNLVHSDGYSWVYTSNRDGSV